jgi:hypothetical protein
VSGFALPRARTHALRLVTTNSSHSIVSFRDLEAADFHRKKLVAGHGKTLDPTGTIWRKHT